MQLWLNGELGQGILPVQGQQQGPGEGSPGPCGEREGASEQGGGQPRGTWSQRTAPLPPPPVAMELTLVFRGEKVVPG